MNKFGSVSIFARLRVSMLICMQPGNPNSAIKMHDNDKRFVVDVVLDVRAPAEKLSTFMQHLEPILVVPTCHRLGSIYRSGILLLAISLRPKHSCVHIGDTVVYF